MQWVHNVIHLSIDIIRESNAAPPSIPYANMGGSLHLAVPGTG